MDNKVLETFIQPWIDLFNGQSIDESFKMTKKKKIFQAVFVTTLIIFFEIFIICILALDFISKTPNLITYIVIFSVITGVPLSIVYQFAVNYIFKLNDKNNKKIRGLHN